MEKRRDGGGAGRDQSGKQRGATERVKGGRTSEGDGNGERFTKDEPEGK